MSRDDRGDRDRSARRDREAIERLADEILPALIARLGASDVGELEIRRGDWRVRLRRPFDGGTSALPASAPADAAKGADRRRTARSGHVSAGHSGTASGNGQATPLAAVGPGRAVDASPSLRDEPARLVSISPGVGYFTVRDGVAPGHAVRGGDVLGHVDVLGVKQEVVAPADAVVARVVAEEGEAVEYGQELVRLEPAPRAEPARES